MSVQRFERLLRRERTAYAHLRWRRWGSRARWCPTCGHRPVYRLGEGRYRCGACRYTFGDFTGTWFGQSRVAWKTWLWLLKLFELEVTALQAAQQAGVSYPTALRVYTTIRRAILAQEEPELLRHEVEADESYFGGHRRGVRGRGALGKIPVFGVLERHGQVAVTVVPNVSQATLLAATVKVVKRGSLVYTDKYAGYDTLTFCGYRHLKVDHGHRFARGKVHINGLEGFWSYAKGKLAKHHGVSPWRFPLYLYEMQFRYNHRRADLFELLLDAVMKSVPTPL
jgi:transposase